MTIEQAYKNYIDFVLKDLMEIPSRPYLSASRIWKFEENRIIIIMFYDWGRVAMEQQLLFILSGMLGSGPIHISPSVINYLKNRYNLTGVDSTLSVF